MATRAAALCCAALLLARPASASMPLTLGARLKSSYAEAASRARAPAASNDCDNLPGPWTGFSPPTHPLGDAYSLAWAGAGGARGADGAFVATMVDGSGWGLGQGTVSADNATASIVFDSGVSLKGTVGDNCTSILWDNDTKWATAPAPSSVSVVHVVAMNHLDVGYDGIPLLGLINNILNRYFDVYFPRAIAVAAALRARGGPERLIYTTHAFLVHLYLHCPANFVLSNVTLACPSPDAVAAFRAAVAAGDIVWHAGAFNTEYENALNAAGIDAQLGLAAALADELGVPRPRTVSLRDVPGTTRSLLPHLKRWNITAISVGVNNGSPAPVTPNPGVWRDAASGAEALFMQTGQGQGYPNNPGPDPANCGGMCASSCVTFPGLTHALCWAFRTDNSGPPIDMDEVFRQFDIARWQFPGATVIASTFDAFTAALEGVRGALPVFTSEVGDTWMTSTTADPYKMAAYREGARALAACTASGACAPGDAVVLAFTRLLAKMPEHTYGLPGVDDDAAWTNALFAEMRAARAQPYVDALNSYVEQRDIFMREGLAALGAHPLAAELVRRWASLAPARPDVAALTPVPRAQWGAPVALALPAGGAAVLALDAATGGLASLTLGGRQWAAPGEPLLALLYATYNVTDYAPQKTCCYDTSSHRQAIAQPNSTRTLGNLTGVWVDSPAAPTKVVVQLAFPADLHAAYGAPGEAWLTLSAAPAAAGPGAGVAAELVLLDKPPTRLGEGLFVRFRPAPGPPAAGAAWAMDKLGSWVDPLDVVANGGLHQHGVATGVAYFNAAGGAGPGAGGAPFLALDTLDAAVVNPATAAQPASMFPQPLTPLNGPTLGFDVQLFQNAFSTNTPQFSFDDGWKFRFVVRADGW